jgi:predicted short-subunit dehydrogenase-like oxidoreductase (DUF2520 family)
VPTPDQVAIGIAGAGRVAQAIGRLLAERGERVVAVASRNHEHAAAAAAFIAGDAGETVCATVSLEQLPERAGRVLIAVSDDALAEVARRLAAAGMSAGAVLHTCGARGPEILEPLSSAGVSCGVLHPLQTVASPEQGVRDLPGAAFAISGDPDAVAWAGRICGLLGGTPLAVAPGRMPLYHAAAVMASNYTTALIDAAVILMVAAGIDEKTALGALGPLVRASVENTLAMGPGQALTGPIQRGDVETLRRHIGSLAGVSGSAGELYRAAGRCALELARRRGLDESQAGRIERLLEEGR